MAVIADPVLPAAALPEHSHFDCFSAGRKLQKLQPATPANQSVAIPNPSPQPLDCLWAFWTALGGSVGVACTQISGWRQRFQCPLSTISAF